MSPQDQQKANDLKMKIEGAMPKGNRLAPGVQIKPIKNLEKPIPVIPDKLKGMMDKYKPSRGPGLSPMDGMEQKRQKIRQYLQQFKDRRLV